MRMPSGVFSTITCDGESSPYSIATDLGITSVQEFWPLIHFFNAR